MKKNLQELEVDSFCFDGVLVATELLNNNGSDILVSRHEVLHACSLKIIAIKKYNNQ